MILWHNGAWREDHEAVFSAADRIRLGDGVFDTVLVVDGRPVHADLHWARLRDNTALMQIPLVMTCDEFIDRIAEIVQKNKAGSGRYALNTFISRGPGERGLMLPESPRPTLIMRLSPVPSEFPPIHAVVAKGVRRNEGSPLSRIKSCNYGDGVLALIEAQQQGANEAILLNNAGHITCASTSNIFVEQEGAFFTPPLRDGVLNGVVRQVFIQCYGALEKSMTLGDVMQSNAVYLTNSIRGAQALVTLDGRGFSGGRLQIDKDFCLR